MASIKMAMGALFSVLLLVTSAFGQMERERADPEGPVSEVFWSPTLITQETTAQLEGGNLNSTIMHSFGIATRRPVQNFFGFDNVQNVRLGLDYGLTDCWSVGIGRSSLNNVVDLRTKAALLRQNQTNSKPINISLKGSMGMITQENRRPISDDLSAFASALVSRKLSDRISLQVQPMYGYRSSVSAGDPNDYFAVGLGSEVHLSRRFGVVAEYYPVLSERSDGTNNAFSLGLNIETGGHVFQLFFTSTQWHLEEYVISTNSEQFWAGDFRFGFNVNRLFTLVK